jgi:hypothetical protein
MKYSGFNQLLSNILIAILLAGFLPARAADASSAAGNQKFNLFEPNPKPRFPITEITWPAKAGEADICLWRDDRLAAMSLTVDDNSAGDIDWWKEQATTYGFPVTWFVITGRVGTGPYWGTWDEFAELNNDPSGHYSVESHTVLHLDTESPEWKGIDWECAESKAQIEKNIPGKIVSALAYPGGPTTNLNDPAKAAKLYRCARGAVGKHNAANQIDYLKTAAMSSINVGDTKAPWSDVNDLIDRSLFRGQFYRGWAVILQHSVPQVQKDKLQTLFEFIKAHEAQLWLGLFTDVAKYGQERDTATLKVLSSDNDTIRLEVTDLMDDTYFTYPLTVKVRLPDGWKTLAATQGGKATPAKLIQHEDAAYALVDVVPDAGVVKLSAN